MIDILGITVQNNYIICLGVKIQTTLLCVCAFMESDSTYCHSGTILY